MGEPDRLLHRELSGAIIGCFYEAYHELGYGFIESAYRKAFCFELLQRGVAYEVEAPVPLHYKGRTLGQFRVDVLVEGIIVVECKVAKEIGDVHRMQLLNYLHAAELELGLLLNFGFPPAFERLICGRKRRKDHEIAYPGAAVPRTNRRRTENEA